jgi:CRP/FNR family transcriptional regulator
MSFDSSQMHAVTSFSGQALTSTPLQAYQYQHAVASLSTLDARSSSQDSFWRDSMALLEQHVEFGRRKVKTNDPIYQCGQVFETIYVMASGLCKVVNLAPDGREQAVCLHFKGDWLGFDGISASRYACSAIALENSEVWTIRYNHLLQASAKHPLLMRAMLAAMSAQLVRNRDALLSMGTLGTDARVGDFLLHWANSLAERGQRTDLITVQMSRVDIGNYLGMRVESVSRALTKMARCGVIEFRERGRRDISIPSLQALHVYIQNSTEVPLSVLH